MRATHPATSFVPVGRHGFTTDHPHLAPFLVAVAFFVVSGLVALAFTGLPT